MVFLLHLKRQAGGGGGCRGAGEAWQLCMGTWAAACYWTSRLLPGAPDPR